MNRISAQYQQAPVPPGGAMVKRHWIKRHDELPLASQRLLTLQSWDTASKGGPDNDWSVCTTWIVTRNKRWYLLDVWRRRVDYPELKAAAETLAVTFRAQRVIVEDTGAGISLVQELRSRVSRHYRGETRAGQSQSHGRGFRQVRDRPGVFARTCAMARRF